MNLNEFVIGNIFWVSGRRWRCTDIGARTIIAICVDEIDIVKFSLKSPEDKTHRKLTRDEIQRDGWLNGPPYAIAEFVFDEHDQVACTFNSEEK